METKLDVENIKLELMKLKTEYYDILAHQEFLANKLKEVNTQIGALTQLLSKQQG